MRVYPTIWVVAAAVLLGATACQGCEFQATQEGQEGNLEFLYTSADEETDFDRPIAVGSAISMHVEPIGNRSLDEIVDVSSSSSSTLEVQLDEGSSDGFHVIGRSGGEAEVVVEARGGGETYTDRIGLRADEVREVRMGHKCTGAADAAYVVDHPASIELERRNASGEQLIGAADSGTEAARTCQVWLEPEEMQDQPYCDAAGLHFETLEYLETIEVYLTDEIAAASGGATDLGVHVVDPDAMQFEDPAGVLEVDRTDTFELQPYINPATAPGTWDVCTNMELEVEILTPETCRGSLGDTRFTIGPDDENEIRLEGRSTGMCDFDVHLVDEPGLAPWPLRMEVVEE